MEKSKESINEPSPKADYITLIGDLNIDQNPDNDPQSSPEIRALQPSLDQMIMKITLKMMNKDSTIHSPVQYSSLLDLILMSNPDSIKEVYHFKPGISDHDGIAFKLVC